MRASRHWDERRTMLPSEIEARFGEKLLPWIGVAEGKRKFIEDAARVIDGRVERLKEEYARTHKRQSDVSNAADRAAISEAEHCARLIRALALRAYRGDPYIAAYKRWARGEN